MKVILALIDDEVWADLISNLQKSWHCIAGGALWVLVFVYSCATVFS